MALQTEIWVADIAANIFANNDHVRRSINDDSFVENKIVHLPTSGAKPTIVRNRSSVPATVAERTDDEATYNLSEFTSDPTLIRDIDEIEVSYMKRQNVLSEHISGLQETIGTYASFAWTPTGPAIATNIVATTGGNRTVGIAPGATGTRKKVTKADILNAKRILDNMNIPSQGRVLLLPSEMYNDILTDNDVLSSFLMNQGNLPEGVIGRLWGFDVMMRSLVAACTTSTNVVKDPTAATAVTDNALALAWHPQFVRFALGEIKVYAKEDDPTVYGSIFSAMVRAGGRAARKDFKGIVGIVETA